MGKHCKKKKNKSKVVILVFQLVLVVVLIYSLVQILKWYFNNKKSEQIMQEISNAIIINPQTNNELAEEKYHIDFVALKKANSDTVGFLKVNGTDIEYPVVKGTDNDFYLNHSFDKTANTAGWIFADYKNQFDGTDKNIVIYGHNRRDGSMFFTLKNILKEEWYSNKENLRLLFITESEEVIYEVFSVYQIKAENYYIKTNFENDNKYDEFLDTIIKRSKNNFNVDVTVEDKILTLSTCANDNKYRVVLHAKKID